MIDFSEATLSGLSIHQVGNKTNDEGFLLSADPVTVNDSIASLLTSYFTKPFNSHEFYNFTHETDLNLNEVYTYAKAVFQDLNSIQLQSINLAKHLYEHSVHPKIKSGELYVAYFEGCYLDDEPVDALGIFKSEQKETFLKVYPEGRSFAVQQDEGININKLDKGCLIFHTDEERGYRIQVVDHTNRGEETRYWNELFLNIAPRSDTYFHTKNYLQLCKDFSVEAFPEADRIDQVSLVEESVKFFGEEEAFDKVRFQEKVLQEPQIIDAFEHYKEQYGNRNQVQLQDDFDIHSDAVKKMKRVFKSVIKLDKNFHIYVHGNRNYIRKGFDEESNMSFYQLFFKEER